MRSKNYKGRCVKRALPKFAVTCRTYDTVQTTYALNLSKNPEIESIQCNVLLEDYSEGEYTTDFVITKTDGSTAVRECVLRKNLLRPRTVKLLDFSHRYWLKKGITDWKVVINAEKK